jgi:DNA-binding transcriptional ArsR family regulator
MIDYKRLALAETHPLRVRILEALDGSEMSPTMLADEFDEPLGNVSYHVKSLLDFGFLRLEKTEPRRGAVEHFYCVVAEASA